MLTEILSAKKVLTEILSAKKMLTAKRKVLTEKSLAGSLGWSRWLKFSHRGHSEHGWHARHLGRKINGWKVLGPDLPE